MILQDWDVDGVDLQDFLDINKDELKGKRIFYIVSDKADYFDSNEYFANAEPDEGGPPEEDDMDGVEPIESSGDILKHRYKIGIANTNPEGRLETYIKHWGQDGGFTGDSKYHGALIHFCYANVKVERVAVTNTNVYRLERHFKNSFKNLDLETLKGMEHVFTYLETLKDIYDTFDHRSDKPSVNPYRTRNNNFGADSDSSDDSDDETPDSSDDSDQDDFSLSSDWDFLRPDAQDDP